VLFSCSYTRPRICDPSGLRWNQSRRSRRGSFSCDVSGLIDRPTPAWAPDGILLDASNLISRSTPARAHDRPMEKEGCGSRSNQSKYGYLHIHSPLHGELTLTSLHRSLITHTPLILPQYSRYRVRFSKKSFLVSAFSHGQMCIVGTCTTTGGICPCLARSGNERGRYWL